MATAPSGWGLPGGVRGRGGRGGRGTHGLLMSSKRQRLESTQVEAANQPAVLEKGSEHGLESRSLIWDHGGSDSRPRSPSPWDEGFIDAWKDATPQRTIFKKKLPRDIWVPLKVPKDWGELSELVKSQSFRNVVEDPQKRNYWIYATGRTLFFFLSSLTNQILQIQIAPDLDPIAWGKKFRVELASAMKRVAMSGSRPGIVDSSTRIPSADRVRKLFGSIFELYRRDCDNIYYGIYRSPYDASLRHRQFNLAYVREQFDATRRASMETGHRRKKGRRGMVEMREVLERRSADQAAGVIVVNDAFDVNKDADLMNDLYLLGDLQKYPRYYLQNFHWQTDGWLSTASAKAYEYTTESLFSGVQDAMQRAGFVSVSELITLRKGAGVEEENIRLLEVACGTGRLHTFLKDNWPQLDTVMADLSPYYLQEARENMDYFIDFALQNTGRVIRPPSYVQTRAEDLPFQDGEFDMVTCVYLFHEIPMKVRHR